jgi:hypothetical protein
LRGGPVHPARQWVFAQIPSHPARALVAQAFVGMIAVVGLALALGRDERAALVEQLRTAERAAARQAKMMTAIIDSMTEASPSSMRKAAFCYVIRPYAASWAAWSASPTGWPTPRAAIH